MKSSAFVFLSILSLLPAGAWAAPPEGYQLKWADEFEGSKVDLSKWVYRTDSKHWSTQRPENVIQEKGRLVLLLKKEEAGGMHYTGAGVISKPNFRFGYYESKFRVLAGKGWHSSFWMMGHDGSGSTATTATALELDVIENDSIDLTSYGTTTHKWQGQHTSHGHKKVALSTLADFHVFGCEYSETSVKYFLDGTLVQTVDLAGLPHSDLSIWLTSIASQLGKTDAVDDSKLPGRVEYEYVRFYEKGK
ncbi:glycoside hydrolase family 16 protein [Paludibaculum fermentans]|uniref:Glycoside hydrolase family 16 protein n=1 Tax=Paludibaculum fermentans TaxID=1473598 RepID=A0A7S7NTJ8_PALFE|nr:glycoside hydrolase family 16 protein [Paludibaculum fermentans]QOY89568.1 glycoside hydrolase family 16 protein [Paludibaculum fermentans]